MRLNYNLAGATYRSSDFCYDFSGDVVIKSIPFQNLAKGGGTMSDKQIRQIDTASITEKLFVILFDISMLCPNSFVNFKTQN